MDFLERVYHIEGIEYRGREERSLFVSAGTGLMLAVMDLCPRLRWCVDVDGLDGAQWTRFADWLICAAKRTEVIAFAGWYCATDPKPVADALRRIGRRDPCYAQCRGTFGNPFADLSTAHDLATFIDQVNGWGETPP